MKPTLKSWATPLIISAFIISGITGILLFFHKEGGLVKPAHEWLSWALVAGATLHTASHWKSFTGYFSKKSALAIISAGVVIAVASVTAPIQEGHGNPFMKAGKALASASVETVAPVARLTPAQAVEKLEKRGIRVGNPTESIKAIAATNGKKDAQVLEALFE
ncbi:MAG: DUF4405 domain-containing protein [Chlorobiaceae bacterium]|nr:DUF4405 domain-containing protein [Chlorobiaceae bacterium]